jgi:hypothetical protein
VEKNGKNKIKKYHNITSNNHKGVFRSSLLEIPDGFLFWGDNQKIFNRFKNYW